jgi:hypothetical protein
MQALASSTYKHVTGQEKNRIEALSVHGIDVIDEPQIAQCFFDHYIGLLGTPFSRTRRLDLNLIGLPSCDLSHIENIFSEEEVRKVVIELPKD